MRENPMLLPTSWCMLASGKITAAVFRLGIRSIVRGARGTCPRHPVRNRARICLPTYTPPPPHTHTPQKSLYSSSKSRPTTYPSWELQQSLAAAAAALRARTTRVYMGGSSSAGDH